MNYIGSMQRALDFVDDNIKSEINTMDVSKQAYMSHSYFSKVFRIMTGYSVKEYITVYRLHLATQDLLMSEKRIIDIALEYGYNSQQTFTKAFSKCFGIPPKAFRLTKNDYKPFKKITLSHEGGKLMESCFDNVKYVIKEEFYTIGIEASVDYIGTGHSPIKALWEKWLSEEIYETIPNAINFPETLGITEETRKEEVALYNICMEVSNLDEIPDGLVGKVYPKTTYAVFRTTLNNIKSGEFWNHFYYEWLPQSGYEQPGSILTITGKQITSKPQIEIYRNYECSIDEEMEIYAPIIM